MQSARQNHEADVKARLEREKENAKIPAENITIEPKTQSNIERSQRQKELNMEYVEYRNTHIHVDDLEDQSVTPDDIKQMPMTTYARSKLPPKMTNETLVQIAESYGRQVSQMHHPAVTYEEMLVHTIMPELIKRLKSQ